MSYRKLALSALVVTALIAACKPQPTAPAADAPAPGADGASQAPAPESVPEQPATASAASAMAAFDMGKMPVSDKSLGEWPYLQVPDGYELQSATTKDLARVPFWTGDHLEFVEGKVFQARVREVDDKTYSSFEVLKRIDQALTALGAVKITGSKLLEDVLDKELPENFGTEFNAGAGGYYGGQASNVYVLRTADHVVWAKVFSNDNEGSLLIAETDATPMAN